MALPVNAGEGFRHLAAIGVSTQTKRRRFTRRPPRKRCRSSTPSLARSGTRRRREPPREAEQSNRPTGSRTSTRRVPERTTGRGSSTRRNRSGEKGFRPYDRANRDARHDAFLLRSRRHAEDYEHQNECQNRFQNKRLKGIARRNGMPERGVFRKEHPQGRAGNHCPGELTGEVRQHKPAGKPPRDKETERDSRVKMTSGHVAERVNHRQHDQANGQRNSDVRNRAPGFRVDNDRPGSDKDKRESSNASAVSFLRRCSCAIGGAGGGLKLGNELGVLVGGQPRLKHRGRLDKIAGATVRQGRARGRERLRCDSARHPLAVEA